MHRRWGLTFDMSGRPRPAQLALGCPLDGGDRRPCEERDTLPESAWHLAFKDRMRVN